MATDQILTFFSRQCRGIKLYDLSHIGARQLDHVVLVREPHSPRDPNCVGMLLCEGAMLGHMAKNSTERRWQSGSLQCFWYPSASLRE